MLILIIIFIILEYLYSLNYFKGKHKRNLDSFRPFLAHLLVVVVFFKAFMFLNRQPYS